MKHLKVYYVNAPASAGKTYAMNQYLHNQTNGCSKTLIVQPTIALVDETYKGITAISSQVRDKPTADNSAAGWQ